MTRKLLQQRASVEGFIVHFIAALIAKKYRTQEEYTADFMEGFSN
ncbi:hypothetical protein [Pantoea sp. Nvir]|nr:hypothetical protein [Pantoea sp. Nvir]